MRRWVSWWRMIASISSSVEGREIYNDRLVRLVRKLGRNRLQGHGRQWPAPFQPEWNFARRANTQSHIAATTARTTRPIVLPAHRLATVDQHGSDYVPDRTREIQSCQPSSPLSC
jgi:hypothetical protein